MRRSLAAACGEARQVASAPLGSGRSRFAAPRRRIRLEASAQAKAVIRPPYPVQNPSPTSLWKLWKTPVVEPQNARWAFERAVRRLYDARPSVGSLERGTCGKKCGKSANFFSPSHAPLSTSRQREGRPGGPPFESARHARLCGQDVRFAPTASCAIGALIPPPSGGFCRQRETGPPPGPVSSLP